MILHLRSAVATDRGLRRKANEDAVLNRPDIGLFAVCDGVGGAVGGAEASGLAVGALQRVYPADNAEDFMDGICDALIDAHNALNARGQGATTVAALAVRGNHAALLWAGDSRIYRYRAGVLEMLTRDHTIVQEMIDAGVIDAAAARVHPRRNVITNAIGAGAADTLEISINQQRIEGGDRFLLCSDGLSGVVDESEIATLAGDADLRAAVDALIKRVLELGAPDNVTVILVEANATGVFERGGL